MSFIERELRKTSIDLYSTFKNAFSFTLAVTSVDKIVQSNDRDLLVLAITLATVIIMVALIDVVLKSYKNDAPASASKNLQALISGPLNMGLYVMDTTLTVLIHFLSTTLGRWALTLGPGNMDVIEMIPMFITTMSLLWLLGRSTGAV